MGNVGQHYHTWRYTPVPEPGEEMFVGFLSVPETTGLQAAPRRELNATPVTKGSVSIVRLTSGEHDYVINFDVESAGEITGYQIRYYPPYPQPGERVMLERTVEPGSSNLGSLTDGFDLSDLSIGSGPDLSAGQFNDMLADGRIAIFVTTTQNPNGLEGLIHKAVEHVFGAELRPTVPVVQSFGNVSFHYDAAENQIDYSIRAFASNITGARLEWDDEDGGTGPRVIDAVVPVLGVPTQGVITAEDVAAQAPDGTLPMFAQQLFSGNVNIVVTTGANPNGELAGTTFPINPLGQPTLHIAVQNGANIGVDTFGRGTGAFTWTTPGEIDLLVTSADLAGVNGLQINLAQRGQTGQILLKLPFPEITREVNGVLGEWTLTSADLGISIEKFVYYLDSDNLNLKQTTAEHPEGAIGGQWQFPYALEPLGLYLGQLHTIECQEPLGRDRQAGTDYAFDAPANHECGPSITIMYFHALTPQGYSVDSMSWDMLCDGAEGLESVTIRREGEGTVLAELVPTTPADRENANGFCGTGAVTLTGEGASEPWQGDDEEWPPFGSAQDDLALRLVQAQLVQAQLEGRVEPIWQVNIPSSP